MWRCPKCGKWTHPHKESGLSVGMCKECWVENKKKMTHEQVEQLFKLYRTLKEAHKIATSIDGLEWATKGKALSHICQELNYIKEERVYKAFELYHYT